MIDYAGSYAARHVHMHFLDLLLSFSETCKYRFGIIFHSSQLA